MMQAMAFCGALAVFLPFVISAVAGKFGKAVSERVSGTADRTAGGGRRQRAADRTDAAGLGHGKRDRRACQGLRAPGHAARPAVSRSASACSLTGGQLSRGLVSWPGGIASRPDWLWWILPVVYIAFDFAEDSVIVVLLSWPSSITDGGLKLLSVLRFVRIASVGAAWSWLWLLGVLSFV